MKTCKEEGCEGKHVARGYCSKHYYHYKNRGVFTSLRRKEAGRGCAVEECDNKHYSRDYCRKHYARLLRSGSAVPPTPEEKYGFCPTHPDTLATVRYDGVRMCKPCYARLFYYNGPKGTGSRFGVRSEYVDYAGAHYRIRTERGRASEHDCVDCGQKAEEWSLDTLENTIIAKKGRAGSPYSLVVSDYSPRCKECHISHDVFLRDGKGYGNWE